MPEEDAQALEEELKNRECSLMHVPGYGLERVVFVLVLKIRDESGFILMQLGVLGYLIVPRGTGPGFKY